MTDEQLEQIKKHFDELRKAACGRGHGVNDIIAEAMRMAYVAGADYALDMFAPRWISVEDELPPKDGRYLFYDTFLGPRVSAYYVECTLVEEITHWMHLPQPPKEGGAE